MKDNRHFDSLFEATTGWVRRILPTRRATKSGWKFNGLFDARCFNTDGSLAWQEIFPNGTTNVGLDRCLSVHLGAGTQITTWYMGLINNSPSPSLVAGDTMSSHGGWVEAPATSSPTSLTYDETTRPVWTPSAVSGQSITNPSNVNFTINTTVTIAGAFLVSDNTKGGTSGIIWAHGLFGSAQSLVATQVLKVTYTCTATGS